MGACWTNRRRIKSGKNQCSRLSFFENCWKMSLKLSGGSQHRIMETGCVHCPESNSLRGFFVYTSGSVLLRETRTSSPNTQQPLQLTLHGYLGSFSAALIAQLTRLFAHLFHISAGCLTRINSKVNPASSGRETLISRVVLLIER